MEGWIKLHRGITSHWIWKDPSKLKWWIDILIVVNHAPAKVNIGMQLFDCGRGQSIMSLSSWADRWKISKDKARNFLVLLEKDGMITHESLGKTTRITVCNYDSYQSDLHDSQTISQRSHNDNQTLTHPNKNDKNKKNDNNEKNIETEVSIKSEKKQKIKFSDHVSLTQDEYSKLVEDYTESGAKRMIEILNNYKGSSGKKYKSDYLAILNWVVNRYNDEKKKNPQSYMMNFEQAGNDSGVGYEDTMSTI